LRQVYYCLILSQWFKANFNRSSENVALVNTIDKCDLTGLASGKPWSKEAYFKAYQKSFSRGEYKKEETVSGNHGLTVRTYVSGGIKFNTSSLINTAGVNGMVLGGEQKLPAEYVTGLTMVNPDTGSVILAQPESDALLPRDGGSSKDAMPETDYLRVQKTTALISTVFIGAALAVVSTGAYLIGGGLTASIVAAALAGLTMYLAGPAFFSQIAQTIAFKMLYGETREAGHSELSGKEASYPKDFGKQTNKDAVVAQSTTLRRIMGNIIFMAYGFILITAGSVVTYCIAHDLIRSANPEAAGIIGGFIGFLLALHPFWTSLDMRGDEMHEESNSKAAQQSESGKMKGKLTWRSGSTQRLP